MDLPRSGQEPNVADPGGLLTEVRFKPKFFSHLNLDSVSPETRIGLLALSRGESQANSSTHKKRYAHGISSAHNRVGIISANGNHEVGEKFADAMEKVGKEAAREGLEGAAHLQIFPGSHPGPKLLPRLALG